MGQIYINVQYVGHSFSTREDFVAEALRYPNGLELQLGGGQPSINVAWVVGFSDANPGSWQGAKFFSGWYESSGPREGDGWQALGPFEVFAGSTPSMSGGDGEPPISPVSPPPDLPTDTSSTSNPGGGHPSSPGKDWSSSTSTNNNSGPWYGNAAGSTYGQTHSNAAGNGSPPSDAGKGGIIEMIRNFINTVKEGYNFFTQPEQQNKLMIAAASMDALSLADRAFAVESYSYEQYRANTAGLMEARGATAQDLEIFSNIQMFAEVSNEQSKMTSYYGTSSVTLTGRITVAWGSDAGDTVYGGVGIDIMLAARGNDVQVGRGGDDVILGGTGNDRLFGGSGNDYLVAGAGTDVLNGGEGSDTASFRNASEGVFVDLRLAGPQRVSAGDGRKSIAAIENIVGSQYSDDIRGNDLSNFVDTGTGGGGVWTFAGDDIVIDNSTFARDIDLGTGNDRLYVRSYVAGTVNGGAGRDWLDFSGQPTPAGTVDLRRGFNSVGETIFVGFENVIGSSGDDDVIGNGGANAIDLGVGNDKLQGMGGADRLLGGDGDDLLEGGAGADWLFGNLGNDTASYANSQSAVTIDLDVGTTAGGDAAGDIVVDVENVDGSIYDDVLIGDQFANRLSGGAGNDRLNGRDGDDVLLGGFGSDTLAGGAGDDLLDGAAGDDSIDGGAGIDTVTYANAEGKVIVRLDAMSVIGAAASRDALIRVENVIGSAFGDTLVGDAQANTIEGGSGNDRIIGAAGADNLIGGLGSDKFILRLAEESDTAGGPDRILDFDQGNGGAGFRDALDFSAIDALASVDGNNAFALTANEGVDGFTSNPGQIRWYLDEIDILTIVEGDVDGDGHADFTVELVGHFGLGAVDFIL